MKWLPEGWQDVGAVAGMIALAWQAVVSLRNRPRFKFEAYTAEIITQGAYDGWQPQPTWVVAFTVTNTGNMASFLSGIHGRVSRESMFLIDLRDLPRELKPGEKWIGHSASLSPLDCTTLELWAEDNLGNKFKLSGRKLQRIMADARQIDAESRSAAKAAA